MIKYKLLNREELHRLQNSRLAQGGKEEMASGRSTKEEDFISLKIRSKYGKIVCEEYKGIYIIVIITLYI